MVHFIAKGFSSLRPGIDVRRRVDREFTRDWLGKDGAPEVYFNTYNTADHLAARLGPACTLIARQDRAIRNHQHVVLFRRSGQVG